MALQNAFFLHQNIVDKHIYYNLWTSTLNAISVRYDTVNPVSPSTGLWISINKFFLCVNGDIYFLDKLIDITCILIN